VLAEAEGAGMPCVYVDLGGVLSFEQIAEVIERAYRMMRELFDNRERPFYAQARAIVLESLAEADLADWLRRRYRALGDEELA
jgi:hypothetical protein